MKIKYKLKFINNEIQKRVIREVDAEMEIYDRFDFINKNEMETPEAMKFIYAMMRKSPGAYQYKPEQIEKAEQYMQQLTDFDPHNIYSIDKENNLLKKETRTAKPLTGELAELEDLFIKDKSRAAKDRQYVVRLFNDIKTGYKEETKEVIEELRLLIKGNTLF
jgi:hypothetical protein